MSIADGEYKATYAGAEIFTAKSGVKCLRVTWLLDEPPVSVTEIIAATRRDGEVNRVGFACAHGWAPAWPDNRLEWFVENPEACRDCRARVTIRADRVQWVLGLKGEQTVRAERTVPQTPKLVWHAERIADLPQTLEPTMRNAYGVFCTLADQGDKALADKRWTELAAMVGPHQAEFTPEDWQKVIDIVKEQAHGN